MKKEKIKRLLDFTPLVILIAYAIVLIWTVSTTDFVLTWRNMVGLIILPLNVIVFWWQHNVGVLLLGLTLILGLLGMLSYVAGLTSTTITLGFNDFNVKFWGEPMFLLWIMIHFIVSGRYYVGILTKEYWQKLVSKQNIQTSE
jgi:hypothetical protein